MERVRVDLLTSAGIWSTTSGAVIAGASTTALWGLTRALAMSAFGGRTEPPESPELGANLPLRLTQYKSVSVKGQTAVGSRLTCSPTLFLPVETLVAAYG